MNENIKQKLNEILLTVQKPARYIGGELNIAVKEEARVRMAICYPDLYEVAMSNHGLQILYGRANSVKGAACERVFAVDTDMEEALRRKEIPLYTLETFTPLCGLDMVGFNVSHELLYTNILQVLDLGGIPLCAEERKEGDPVIIAGGGAVSNPCPLYDFIDLFYLGDGEEGIVDIARTLMEAKEKKMSRGDTIKALAAVEGVLAPGIIGGAPEGQAVKRRNYTGDMTPVNELPVVPSMKIVQDRAVLDVSRGCDNLCKFCHAGYYELPYRPFFPEGCAQKARQLIEATGYGEITFSSLSIGDYAGLPSLLEMVLPYLTERGVSVSLPSLRVDKATIPLIDLLSGVRKPSITFALESASSCLRERANKRLDMEDFYDIVEKAAEKGWRHIKIYIMLGLPGCGEIDEAEETVRFCRELTARIPALREIHVTLSPFVPKPHTPFERERQMDMEYFDRAVSAIRKGVPRKIKIKNHDVRASTIEGFLSRGDRRAGRVVRGVYESGGRHDSWREHFRYDLWCENLEKFYPRWEEVLEKRNEDEVLPWSSVSNGFEKLKERYVEKRGRIKRSRGLSFDNLAVLPERLRAEEKFREKYEAKGRARITVAKKGPARYISHLEMIDVVKRALRMAEVPVAFSRGFNKREKISAGYPLPLGMESECELFELELYREYSDVFFENFRDRLPVGFHFSGAREIPKDTSLMALIQRVSYSITCDREELFAGLCRSLEKGNMALRKKKRQKKTGKITDVEIPFERAVLSAEIEGEECRLLLSVGGGDSLRVDEIVMQLSGIGSESFFHFSVTKTGQYDGEGIPVS